MPGASPVRVELVEEMAQFTHDPLGHALFAYPWETGALDSPGPRRWQAETLATIGAHLQDPAKRFTPLRIAIASGHGTGKSGLISMLLNWALDTCPDARGTLTANTEGQLITKTMPELSKWRGLSITRDWFRVTATAMMSTATGHDRAWRADAVPWSLHNVEAFAGLHNQGKRLIVIFDEASSIPDKIWEVTEGALTDEGTESIWIAVGNPTRNSGRFRDCFGRFRNRWHTMQLDSRTVEGTNREYLDQIVQTYGEDSDIARVRVRGVFPSASSLQFISSDEVGQARKRPLGTDAYVPTEPVIFGVDHARFGDDRSVLAVRQGRDARSRPWLRWQGADSMRLAGDIAEHARTYHPDAIFVDAGGPNAGGVIDRLRQLLGRRYPVFEVNFGGRGREANWNDEIRVKTLNKRAEMWANMRAWIKRGVLPDEQQLEDDLTGVEYSYGPDQSTLVLEKKSMMKSRGLASPDDGDALALTFAEHVARRDLPAHLDPENYARLRPYDRYEELA